MPTVRLCWRLQNGRSSPAVRGAVWFELICRGKPGHSGRASDVVSALKEAVKAMGVLEEYHDRLLASSRGFNPLFDSYENPMPVTFGMLQAGDWPATAPGTALVKGVFGFLPEYQCQSGAARNDRGPKDFAAPVSCGRILNWHSTMLNNEGNELADRSSARSGTLHRGAGVRSADGDLGDDCGMRRLALRTMMNIPTVVMGAGSLSMRTPTKNRSRLPADQGDSEDPLAFPRALVLASPETMHERNKDASACQDGRKGRASGNPGGSGSRHR